ncbi:MAG: DUF4390 domain-containing protein [Burkholderiales bacterium]|nr:DUF4390 domain-containing protein [Burkholderiales bacterium]MCJ7838015.1 DUF4390 domain-containing protein [Burkholderiales bacterium]
MSLRLLVSLLLLLALCWSAQTRAEDIEISHISIEANDDGYILDADFEIDLNPRLEDAINKGVALYFEVEFELTRKRWYWFDEHPVSRQLTLRLSYHALTRQYRISRGALHQSFSSLTDALRVLSRVRSWRVLERGEVGAGTDYEAALRMLLDVTQLPKPFQVSALTNRDWNLASEWRRWPLQIKAPVTEKAPR